MVSDEPCPISYGPYSHNIVSSLPKLIYTNFELKNDSIEFKGTGLIDTGSTVGLIEKSILNPKVIQNLKSTGHKVTGVGGDASVIGSLIGTVNIGGARFEKVRFDVIEKITPDVKCILGLNIFNHPSVQNMNLDVQNKTITFIQKGYRNKLVPNKVQYTFDQYSATTSSATVKSIVQKDELLSKSLREKLEFLKSERDIELYHENPEYLERFANMLVEHLDVFGDGELGLFDKEVEIKTKGEPVSVRQHPINKEFAKDIDAQIQELKRLGVIEPCPDPRGWNSPVVCVRKKDGTPRMCVNLKNTVNKRLCEPDPYPSPAIDELFNDIPDGCHYFSNIDFEKGYWQLKLKEKCRHILAFTWNDECLQYARVPMGFTASGAMFSRAIASVLNTAKVNRKFCKIYIDDVAIMARTFDEFINEHAIVFKAVKSFNLKLKASKCSFLKQEVPFIGRLISSKGMRPIPEFVEGVMSIQPPKNMKEVKSLMGRCVWLKSFIGLRLNDHVKLQNFSHVMEPIFEVSRKKTFHWTIEADNALKKLKSRMSSCPFISYCDPSLPYLLVTDASDVALGAILMQKKGSEYRVIATVSKCFSATERRWSATERECYAVLYSCRKLEYFLGGVHFTVHMDHKSLIYLDRRNFNNSKICRWQSELSLFSFTIEYIEGTSNVWADWLSRPGGIKPEVKPEDFTPAGEFYEVENTPLRIYIPSWVKDQNDQSTLKLRALGPNGESRDETRISIACAAVLSNRKVSENSEETQYLTIAEKQRQDAFLEKIILGIERSKSLEKSEIANFIDKKDHRSTSFYRIADSLFIDPSTRLLMVKRDEKVQVILPDCLRKQYLFSAHDTLGHCGSTREHLRHYFWVGKLKDIDDYVGSCELCAQRKGNYGKNQPSFGHNLKGENPFDILYMDYIVMKPSHGYRYCYSGQFYTIFTCISVTEKSSYRYG